MPEEPRHYIFIRILNFKKWEPTSRTEKLDDLLGALDEAMIGNLHDQFARFILKLFVEKVKKCIDTQIFPVKYAPLSKAYVAKKKAMGRKPGFWRSSEYLLNHIIYWKMGDGAYVIGFPEHLKHPDSGQPVAEIARTLELGNPPNLPPRPLFTPIGALMSKSIFFHFRQFISKEHAEYLKYLK